MVVVKGRVIVKGGGLGWWLKVMVTGDGTGSG